MLEYILLGTIQGIAEWLPISSEGLIVLIKTNFFAGQSSFEATVRLALFLHLGTLLAALVYFKQDVIELTKGLFNYTKQSARNKKLINFLFIATIVSGSLGLILIKTLSGIINNGPSAGKIMTLCVGWLLFITAYLELKTKKDGYRTPDDLNLKDSLILGIVQGFAALPGLSRSGLTVSALLLRKMDKAPALKLSFLMSLPIVLAGNIILNFNHLVWSWEGFVGLLFSFAFGLLTIHGLLKLAQKINFGHFVLAFAILTVVSTLI